MSAETLGWVFEHSPYTGSKLLIHLVLGDVANSAHDYELWITVRNLARKARLSQRAVHYALEGMILDGLLERLDGDDPLERQKAGRAVRYRFLMPEVPSERAGGSASIAEGGLQPRHGGSATVADHNYKELNENNNERAISDFEGFWKVCPKKVGKGQAKKAYLKVVKSGEEPETLFRAMEGYRAHVAGSDPRFICHPSTWLNNMRWLDELKAGKERKTRVRLLERATADGFEQFEHEEYWDEGHQAWLGVEHGQS